MEWLRELRHKKNMTMRQVADAVGVTEGYICMLEKDKKRPSVDLAKKLANIYKINWTKFFRD